MKNFFNHVSDFFEKKENFYHIVLLLLIVILLTTDGSISFAVILSSIIASSSFEFVKKMKKKFNIPKPLTTLIIVVLLAVSLFYLLKKIMILIIEQSSKILLLISNEQFINAKIEKLHNIFDKISESLLSLKERAGNIPYGLKKIETFIDDLPDIIMYKLINFIQPFIEKLYIPGLKLVTFFYTLILFLVFSFYFINDWDKIQAFLKYTFGRQNRKVLQIVDYIKNVIIKIFLSQVKVALILTALYSLILYSIKFEYFLIYAILFSFFTLIPLFGYIFSFTILSVSCFIFGYPLEYSIKLLLILACGMLVENLILTPKFVGHSINSHPLVVLLCLLILPNFLGVLGVIFVLPFVAILSKIVSYIQDELDKSLRVENEQL